MGADCYPSSGFDGALDKATWANVQAYLMSARSVPKSPDPQAEAILTRIEQSASTASADLLPQVNSLANSLYNYAQTAASTFQALKTVVSQPNPDKTTLNQLIGNLKDSAGGLTTASQGVAHGLATFHSSTDAAGVSLQQLLTATKAKASSANDTVSSSAQALGAALAASDLDSSAIASDMKAIQQAASGFDGVSFVGLTFSVAPGVTAAQAAATGIAAMAAASTNLTTQLGDLLTQIAAADDPSQVPCLSELSLAAATKAWTAIGNEAHNFMLNFYVTPSPAAPTS